MEACGDVVGVNRILPVGHRIGTPDRGAKFLAAVELCPTRTGREAYVRPRRHPGRATTLGRGGLRFPPPVRIAAILDTDSRPAIFFSSRRRSTLPPYDRSASATSLS